MKFKLLSLLCLTVLPTLASAAAPVPYKMDDTTLGHLDAALTLCAKADAPNLLTYRHYRTALIVPDHDSVSQEFKHAYEAVVDVAEKVSRVELTAQCVRAFGI